MKRIRQLLVNQKDLGASLRAIHRFFDNHPHEFPNDFFQQLENIDSDYLRMKEFMLKGFEDLQRAEVYQMLLRRTMRFLGNCEMFRLCRENRTFNEARGRALHITDQDVVRQMLESYVQNQAMLSLEPSDDKMRQLHEQHFHQLGQLFNTLLTSWQWHDSDREFYVRLLVSPTIDSADACVLTSAVMLSATAVADINKIQALFDIYRQAADERIRQRALVGVAFALPSRSYMNIYPEYAGLIKEICADKFIKRELLELQMQVFYCMDAERDNETIQRDIMPGILKNQNIRFTWNGVEEKEEDPLQDLLDPDAEDKAMEELEQSIRKMMNMQQNGVDIYFGGFSQMKRFAFFYTLSNWFTPFYVEHPALATIVDKLRGNRFLQLLVDNASFCDSDKYSFALALSTIIDRLPENMREMLNHQDALGIEMGDFDTNSSAYIRRMYLQDLYRFFRVYTQKSDFRNPFDYHADASFFFLANDAFGQSALTEHALTLGRFLLKRKKYDELLKLLAVYRQCEDPEYHIIKGTLLLQTGNYADAQSEFKIVHELDATNEQVLKGLALSSFRCSDYETAEQCYRTLTDLHPDHIRFQLNQSIAQINNNQVDEGLHTLHKLNYEHPENPNVSRALAWGMLIQGSLAQAEQMYDKLTQSDSGADSSDYLNAGYCQWFSGHVTEAAAFFVKFLALTRTTRPSSSKPSAADATQLLKDAFAGDEMLLKGQGIKEVDILLMLDIVEDLQDQ